MRLLSWNILQGGGKRALEISDAIVEFNPDVAVLQEYRSGKNAAPILDAFQTLNLDHHHIADSEARKNTVMIASRFPLQIKPWDTTLDANLAIEALIDLDLANMGIDQLQLYAAHLPHKKEQVPYLDTLYKKTIEPNAIIIGDLNCGIPFVDSHNKSFVNSHMFQALHQKGWIDSWRSRHMTTKEYSWVSSRGNGYRYDHALCAAELDNQIESIYYDHGVRERKLSDHSALLVDFKHVA